MIAGMTASFTMVVSATIVSVAVPDVMGAFGVGLDQAQLLASAFNVAMVSCQLLNAWVVANLGQRGGFLLMSLVFVVGSVLCGIGQDFSMIVFGRVLQGMAAGVIQPLVMVTAFQVFPAERRGYAMAIYSMGVFMAVAVGPVFGGIAIDLFEWRYIFWAPLPVIVAAALMGWVFMPSVKNENPQPFDWIGYALLVVSVYCFITALSEGTQKGWTSDYIVGLIVIGSVTGVALIMSQLKENSSLIDLSLFRNKQFAMVSVIIFTFGVGNFSSGYGVPVFVQLIQGYSPLDTAMLMLPSSLLVVAALPFTGRLADKIKPHVGIIIGLSFFAIGTIPMSFSDVNTSFAAVMFYFIISRMGMSFTNPFIMNTALGSLPQEKLNAGGGTVNFCRQLGGSLGLAAWVAFVQTRTQFHSDSLTATQSSSNTTTQELISGVGRIFSEAGLPEILHNPGALHFLGDIIHAQARTFGFQDGFLILVISFVGAMIPAYMLGQQRKNL